MMLCSCGTQTPSEVIGMLAAPSSSGAGAANSVVCGRSRGITRGPGQKLFDLSVRRRYAQDPSEPSERKGG